MAENPVEGSLSKVCMYVSMYGCFCFFFFFVFCFFAMEFLVKILRHPCSGYLLDSLVFVFLHQS